MAQIYDFQSHRTAKRLRAFSQQANQLLPSFAAMHRHYHHIYATMAEMQTHHQVFHGALDTHLATLKSSQSFTHACASACELETVEEMVRARDSILHIH